MSILPLIITLLIGSLGLKLFLEDNLTLYVHPRYLVFTVIMNVICFLAALAGLILYALRPELRAATKRPRPLTIGVLVLCLLALFVPPQPLQSSVVEKRYVATQITTYPQSCDQATSDKTPNSFQDWDALLANCSEPERYQGKGVNLIGFIYEDSNIETANVFPMARFVVSCCAIDARPIVLLVKESGWASKYQANDWVQVKGYMATTTVHGKQRAVIVPDTVQKIEQPHQPYEFLGQ